MASLRTSAAFVAAAVVVAACATPYGRSGLFGGYSDRKISDSMYRVEFNGNGYADKEHVWNMWMYRCAELTVEKGFRYFQVKTGPGAEATSWAPATTVPAAARPGQGRLVPAVYRPGRDPGRLHKAYYTYYTITTWNSSGVVLMYPDPMPEDVLWAFDAQVVMAELQSFVKPASGTGKAKAKSKEKSPAQGGRTPPPPREVLLGRAFASHALIEFGTGAVASAPPAAVAAASTAAPAADAPPLRKIEQISATVGGQRPLLAAVYRDLQTRNKPGAPATGGTVVVGFTVGPTGSVRESHLVSSTIKDELFTGLMVEAVRRMDFGAANVSETVVAEYPFTFTPNAPTAAAPAPLAPAAGAPGN